MCLYILQLVSHNCAYIFNVIIYRNFISHNCNFILKLSQNFYNNAIPHSATLSTLILATVNLYLIIAWLYCAVVTSYLTNLSVSYFIFNTITSLCSSELHQLIQR